MDAPTCLHPGPAPFLPLADPAPCLPPARAYTRTEDSGVRGRAYLPAHGPAPFLPRADPAPYLPRARARTRTRSPLSSLGLRSQPVARPRSDTPPSLPSPWGAHPHHTCGRVDPIPPTHTPGAPVARTRMRAPLPPCASGPRLPRARARALARLSRAPSPAGSEVGWSARGARAMASCSARRARLAVAARLFSQCQEEPDGHPGLRRGERAPVAR